MVTNKHTEVQDEKVDYKILEYKVGNNANAAMPGHYTFNNGSCMVFERYIKSIEAKTETLVYSSQNRLPAEFFNYETQYKLNCDWQAWKIKF